MWIATPIAPEPIVDHEQWQRLTAALFYLSWTRIPSVSIDRPAGEDFYMEAFVLPEGGALDSSTHVRWSKYGTTFWNAMTIHPTPEVSYRGIQFDLPRSGSPRSTLFFDPTSTNLFSALEQELLKPESRILTALWFLLESSYRSASRAGFAEDIQNICTAFEALLDVTKKGDSARQVSDGLRGVFKKRAPSSIEKAISGRRSINEREIVLKRFSEWVNALYGVRNAYTHGKPVGSYIFHERSIWQDAFEIFRLAANRVILSKYERSESTASTIEKRLMSVTYFDETVGYFSKKGDWINLRKKRETVRDLKEAIRKSRAMDPQLVESISSLSALRKAIFNMCTATARVLEDASVPVKSDAKELLSILALMQKAYLDSRGIVPGDKLDTDAYIRKVAPRFTFWTPGLPIARDIFLYELIEAMKSLLVVYGNFTDPIPSSLAATL
jgi:hypothetical protein